MKRIFPAVLAFILAIYCTGCEVEEVEYHSPVTFYYCTEELNYVSDSSIIQVEERTVNCPPNDYKSIIQLYLAGPKERGLYCPFPKDLTVTELLVDGETTYITFSTNLSYLTGVDLTLACICIANTCFGLTHTQNVDISAEHALLDNAPSISISYGNTITSDTH